MAAQGSLDLPVSFSKAAYAYGSRSDGGTHGVVLTKPHVVELILDLAGYTSERDLGRSALLEPSCGHGAFLVPAAERLVRSALIHGRDLSSLDGALLAFDIDDTHVQATKAALIERLKQCSVLGRVGRRLVDHWAQAGDFLLAPLPRTFEFVVGNPPYIRIEQLSPDLQAEYRRRYETLFDRADLYVAFIERSLSLLASDGTLSFICADRWTLNRYGAPLRKLITARYGMRAYVDLHKASPFENEVIAYPSIFVIDRAKREGPVRVATLTRGSPEEVDAVRGVALNGRNPASVNISAYDTWFSGDAPWVLSSPEQLAVLRELEGRLPLLEDGGRASVRIGVASGNDSVFIVPGDADIEPDRLLPLVMRDDISNGAVADGGRYVINTFDEHGTIDLDRYPRLKRYFSQHDAAIRRRHVSQKNSGSWFRTIDRVYPELAAKPKLLIPDIAGSNEVVLERGRYYPHHNLYFIISDAWDLEVLGGLLSSRPALFFVWSYAVKMRGGYLRFQAQYLRRIRVPAPESIADHVAADIKDAFRSRDFARLDELAQVAYGLSRIPEFDFVDTRRRQAIRRSGAGQRTAPQPR